MVEQKLLSPSALEHHFPPAPTQVLSVSQFQGNERSHKGQVSFTQNEPHHSAPALVQLDWLKQLPGSSKEHVGHKVEHQPVPLPESHHERPAPVHCPCVEQFPGLDFEHEGQA